MEKTRSAGLEELGVTAEGLKQMTLERATEGEAEARGKGAQAADRATARPRGGRGRRREEAGTGRGHEGRDSSACRPSCHCASVPSEGACGSVTAGAAEDAARACLVCLPKGPRGRESGENEPAAEVAEPPGTSVSEREANVRVPVLSTPRAPACILQMLAELVLVIIL